MATEYHYPLGQHHADSLCTATGLGLGQLTLDAVMEGRVNSDALRISSETLKMQAEIAERAGFGQFAQNLRRGAELASIPENEILHIYTLLRPRRSTRAELLSLATDLEQRCGAILIARMIREAAEAYEARGLTRGNT
jgi:propanediol dehydratase small subunit